MIERIRARRAALAAQIEQAKAQYNELETMLKELDRQILAMLGGLNELDQLIVTADSEQMNADMVSESAFIAPESAVTSTYATGLNGAHESALEGES